MAPLPMAGEGDNGITGLLHQLHQQSSFSVSYFYTNPGLCRGFTEHLELAKTLQA